MKYLVTGGAGFIGSHVVDRLLFSGNEVVVVDNFNDYYDPIVKHSNLKGASKNPNFKLYECDILDFEKIREIFAQEKFDRVIHLAARAGVRPSIKYPQLYMDVNVKGTTNIFELCRQFGIKDIVFASSSSVYGCNTKIPFCEDDDVSKQISPYAVSKRACELLASCYHNLYGLNITGLRFFTVYGPRGRPDMAPYMFMKKIMAGETIERYGDGSTQRDYTFIFDIVDGIIASIGHNGIFNLGNNNPVSLTEFIATIEKVTGCKAKIVEKPMQEGDVLITFV